MRLSICIQNKSLHVLIATCLVEVLIPFLDQYTFDSTKFLTLRESYIHEHSLLQSLISSLWTLLDWTVVIVDASSSKILELAESLQTPTTQTLSASLERLPRRHAGRQFGFGTT